MKKEIVKKFFEFLEKREKQEFPLPAYGTILEMPKKLKVKGDVDIFERNGDNQIFPEELEVGGDFAAFTNPKNPLPRILKASGHITFQHLYRQTVLPETMQGRSIAFIDCYIPQIPDNLTFPLFISIEGSTVAEIPKNMKTDGVFYCANTPLSRKFTAEEIKALITNRGGSVLAVETEEL